MQHSCIATDDMNAHSCQPMHVKSQQKEDITSIACFFQSIEGHIKSNEACTHDHAALLQKYDTPSKRIEMLYNLVIVVENELIILQTRRNANANANAAPPQMRINTTTLEVDQNCEHKMYFLTVLNEYLFYLRSKLDAPANARTNANANAMMDFATLVYALSYVPAQTLRTICAT